MSDGQPPKRRGPKPDSKPALTRRQELNRQAQRYGLLARVLMLCFADILRTHRERKEMYIKALEQEVLRLKELYTKSIKERDAVVEENRRLRDLLSSHGISYDSSMIQLHSGSENYNASSSGSISGSYRPGSDSTGASPAATHGQPSQALSNSSPHSRRYNSPPNPAQLPSSRLDYDQIGIDFVLTYDSQGNPIFPRAAPYPSPPPQP